MTDMTEGKRKYRERAAYFIQKVTERRRKLKEMAVDYKGGKCMVCGYKRCPAALDFHHIDPTKKDFSLSVRGLTRSWERIQSEVDKCLLVCANCHREIHAGLIKVAELGKN
jgi:predicted HNH restriction endonuclease